MIAAMEILWYAVAGLVQGFLEWLPVSSSGQVMLLLIAAGAPHAFSTALALHLATGLSATARYRDLVLRALRNVSGVEMRALVIPLIVGAPIALAIKKLVLELEASIVTLLIGLLLVLSGAVLWLSKRCYTRSRRELTTVDLLIVGVLQGIAVLPGLSRSALVSTYLLLKLGDPLRALIYTFFTGITAQIAAGLYNLSSMELSMGLAISLLTAFIAGYASILAMERLAIRLRNALPLFLAIYGSLILVLNIVIHIIA